MMDGWSACLSPVRGRRSQDTEHRRMDRVAATPQRTESASGKGRGSEASVANLILTLNSRILGRIEIASWLFTSP